MLPSTFNNSSKREVVGSTPGTTTLLLLATNRQGQRDNTNTNIGIQNYDVQEDMFTKESLSTRKCHEETHDR